MAPRVLISDALSPAAVAIFKNRGLDVEFQPNLGKDKDKLAAAIDGFDGLAIRSATKVTAKLLEHAKSLKVIGRAGIGVDNVDIAAATARGIMVMNTPFGNSITTAEHAISLMLALARQIPEADTSTRAGKWEKNKFMGVEIFAKTLGVIGCGNIGSIVADRAVGLKMKVIAYDPFLSAERAMDLGVEKVELEDLFKRADFVTLHTPLTDKTKNIVDAAALKKMKKGVRIVNCARGGLVDEAALYDALKSGHVAGAAFDVFVEEPATSSPLFSLPNVVCTPHLGAATSEAHVNVVSAPIVAKERGIVVEEVTREAEGDYESLITVTVTNQGLTRSVSGTVFADGRPRIVNIKGIRMDAEFRSSMIYITNLDKPGFIGRFSSTLGEAGINIATFHVGREAAGGNAVALIEIDGELPADVLAKVRALPQVQSARPLKF